MSRQCEIVDKSPGVFKPLDRLGNPMLIDKPLPFISAFVDAVDETLRQHSPAQGMSTTQRTWLAFCLTATLVTNSICWARFERASLGAYAMAALSWMFRHSKIPWDQLLVSSVRVILRHYGLSEGTLVIDDTDNKRSKSAKTLAHLHKLRDKESGGYVWGQCLMVLVLITPQITLPVGFAFYQPAPELSQWYKTEKALKKQGVPKKQRPPKPSVNPTYPTKQELALRLLHHFQAAHPDFHITCVSADALYGASSFVDTASTCFGSVQVISQIRGHQKVRLHKREQSVADYFAAHPGTPHTIRIRGGETVVALISSARLYVCSHKTKRFVVALKYEGEAAYRYLIASDLTWRTLDIVQGHTLRWLVEVFIQDWKSYEGWSQLTKQPGKEGARRSVILSLLVDHALFFHPDQHAQLKNKQPAYTVGSLRAHVQVQSLVSTMESLIFSDDPQSQWQQFTQSLHHLFVLNTSKKHMIQRQLGRLEATPYLKYRADEVMRKMPALST
jgi:SRSO17 transposase